MMAKQIRSVAVVALICCGAILADGQSQPTQLEVPNAPIPTYVLVQSPADTQTALQVICLFQSDPANTLHGSLTEINEKLGGLLDQIRKPGEFRRQLEQRLQDALSAAYAPLPVEVADALREERQRIETLQKETEEVAQWLQEREQSASIVGLYGR